jgi:hypothetical protein
MKKNNYIIVNPIVEGNNNVFSGNNSLEAAKNAYKLLSTQYNGIVKKLNFSLLQVDTKNMKDKLYEYDNNKFYHFSVYEKNNNNNVEYSIKAIDNGIVLLNEFKKRAHQVMKKNNEKKNEKKSKRKKSVKKEKKSMKKKDNQEGGKSKYRELEDSDDSDDSDSDDSDYRVKKPKFDDFYFYNWWYNPLIYSSESIYIPNVVYPYYTTIDLNPITKIIKNNEVIFTQTI